VVTIRGGVLDGVASCMEVLHEVLHGGAVWRCCMEVLHGGAAWRCCVEVLHGGAAWRCCMEVLHGGAAWRGCMEERCMEVMLIL
jgi:hypothetical protein